MKCSLRHVLATFPMGAFGVGLCVLYVISALLRAYDLLVGELGFVWSGPYEAFTDLLKAGMCVLLIVAISRQQPKKWGPLVRWQPRSAERSARERT